MFVALVAGGCGHAAPATSVRAGVAAVAASRASHDLPREDADGDSDGRAHDGLYDWDDRQVKSGALRPASRDRQLRLAAMVERYYAAAGAGDGAVTCGLVDAAVRTSVLDEYRPALGMRGGGCAAVMSAIFHRLHVQLSGERSGLRVAEAWVVGAQGRVFVSFGGAADRYLPLRREHGVWKLDALLDGPLP